MNRDKRLTLAFNVEMDPHVYLYLGLNKDDAWKAVEAARAVGAQVDYRRGDVTGSDGQIQHYTVIAYGKPEPVLENLWRDMPRKGKP